MSYTSNPLMIYAFELQMSWKLGEAVWRSVHPPETGILFYSDQSCLWKKCKNHRKYLWSGQKDTCIGIHIHTGKKHVTMIVPQMSQWLFLILGTIFFKLHFPKSFISMSCFLIRKRLFKKPSKTMYVNGLQTCCATLNRYFIDVS
jgi:hypothetical protein